MIAQSEFRFFFVCARPFAKLVEQVQDIRFCSAADIGCGTGLFACYLSRCRGAAVYAVDHSAAMLHEAARNCCNADVCFLQQDIRCLALPSRVESMITANFDTLNHLKNTGRFAPCLPAGARQICARAATSISIF